MQRKYPNLRKEEGLFLTCESQKLVLLRLSVFLTPLILTFDVCGEDNDENVDNDDDNI